MDDNTTQDKQRKPRESKKNSIPMTEVHELAKGINQYEKTSFLMIGHKNGVRLALPKTSGVSRVYFYAGSYAAIPDDPAITVFTEEQRKELRKGGIMAEVNFSLGVDAARDALVKLIDVVRATPAPEAKVVKPKAVRKVKAVVPAAASAVDAGDDDPGLTSVDVDDEPDDSANAES